MDSMTYLRKKRAEQAKKRVFHTIPSEKRGFLRRAWDGIAEFGISIKRGYAARVRNTQHTAPRIAHNTPTTSAPVNPPGAQTHHDRPTSSTFLSRLMSKIPKKSPRRPQKARPPRDSKTLWKKRGILAAKIAGIFALIGIVGIAAVFAYFAKDLPEPGKVNTRSIAESTKIYDRTGTVLLYDIHGEEKRTIIPEQDIPSVVKQATIALEDHNFYNHIGFDVKGVANAVISNIFHVGGGRGGSTITQQFVKNSLLTNERSLTRKIKELILAVEIELRFSKEEILGMYLNEIPYGSNAYGIEAAAQTFFGKNAKDLTLDEAALLASLPQAPSRYSPYGSYTERLKIRQEYALNEMVDLGYISRQDADSAKETDVFSKLTKNTETIKAPHFVMYVRDILEEQYGADALEKEGLHVITTLDWEKQQVAEKIVQERALENKAKYNAENAALVAIDPATGDIVTMVGSRNYFDTEIDGQVNVAIRDRQPGSSFKPYAYLYAFKKGYTPETTLYDVETQFGTDKTTEYAPRNYSGTFNGPVSMKEALGMSLNIPAVKALYLAGPADVIMFAKQLGITTLNEPKRYGLSLVLGGGEVKLVDHTAAFSVFANNGIKHEKRALLRITAGNGTEIYAAQDTADERIIDEKYVAMLSHTLSSNKYRAPVFGENSALRFDDRSVAVKTGTTNDNRDGWAMGYTPDIAVGVWAGNNDNSSMSAKGDGSYVAAPIFRDFILSAYPKPSDKKFPSYDKDDYKTGKDVLDGKMPDDEKIEVCEIPDKDAYCFANDYCPSSKRKKRAFINAHTILYYVNKDDPLGDKPDNPKNDAQYKNWEKGVESYYKNKSKDYIFDEKPRACEAKDFEKYTLTVSLDVPDTTKDHTMTIRVKPVTPYDITNIVYSVDGTPITETKDTSYTYAIPDDANGTTLRIEAAVTDSSGKTVSAAKNVHVQFGE